MLTRQILKRNENEKQRRRLFITLSPLILSFLNVSRQTFYSGDTNCICKYKLNMLGGEMAGRKKDVWSYRQLSCGFSTEFPFRKEYWHIFSVYRLRFQENKRVIDFRSGIFLFPHHNSIVNDLSGAFVPLYSSSQVTCFQYLLLPKVNKYGVKLPVILAEESQKIMTPMIITELFFWYLMRSA